MDNAWDKDGHSGIFQADIYRSKACWESLNFPQSVTEAILRTIVMNTVYCRNYTWSFIALHGLCMIIGRKINIRYNACS